MVRLTAGWSAGDGVVRTAGYRAAEHATEVWERLRDVDGWETRYEIQGLPSVHVAVAGTPGGAGLHEAYRHVRRDLVTFALPGGSVSERPDPALEQIVRHHAERFPADGEDERT